MLGLRRFRLNKSIRDKYADVVLSTENFIYPYFVVEGNGIKKEIPLLKDVFHFSVDKLLEDISEIRKIGINKILLFGVIHNKLKDLSSN